MDQDRKGKGNGNLTCDVCKISFPSSAASALHEFSKKHCDNLIKIAKCKPVVNKQKVKSKQVEKEPPKVNVVTNTGSFSMYGYFAPGEIYKSAEVSREFNTEYDPYLQKFAENPLKKVTPTIEVTNETHTLTHCTNVSFIRKKKRKIKTCQICNITLQTVPEYEAHMKSSEHIWKLKSTGMGVSAHFVKASTNLHTTDINEDCKQTNQTSEKLQAANTLAGTNLSSASFSELYCQDCELLLNSAQQYNSHLHGKSHVQCAQRKAELKANKEKLLKPISNQLYCYSCKISLNNLFQYNEHKNGKKHKAKCMQLIRRGMSIPPEERFPSLNSSEFESGKMKHSELYEKFLPKNQDEKEVISILKSSDEKNSMAEIGYTSQESCDIPDILQKVYECSICNLKFETLSEYDHHLKTTEHYHDCFSRSVISDAVICNTNLAQLKTLNEAPKIRIKDEKGSFVSKDQNIILPSVIADASSNLKESSQNTDYSALGTNSSNQKSFSFLTNINTNHKNFTSEKLSAIVSTASEVVENSVGNKWKSEGQIVVINSSEPLKCNICSYAFNLQEEYDLHLNTEEHFQKILEFKINGCSNTEILKIIFCDRSFVKPDLFERLNCSICNVVTVNKIEFQQHLKSVVHKYAEKEFKRKKLVEVKNIKLVNEMGFYFCKLCKEGFDSLVNFTLHLHCVKHRSIQCEDRTKKNLAKRRALLLKNRKLSIKMKGNIFLHPSLKTEKNPGVRTKIGGVATDLCTGAQALIPNLEPLEPKIDPSKNVYLGVSENLNKEKVSKKSRTKKPARKLNKDRKLLGAGNNLKYLKSSPSLTTSSCVNIPPFIPSFSQSYPPVQRPSKPPYFMSNRHWTSFSNPHQFRPRFYYNKPPVIPFCEPSWCQRPYLPRYLPRYR